MPVRVQIAGVSTLDEALAAERAGADALGFTVRLPRGLHDGLTEEKARRIVAQLPPLVASVAITYVGTARDAIELCRYLAVTTVQLHGPFPMAEIPSLRSALPYLKIITAVHVTGPEAIEAARKCDGAVDAVILDTYDTASGRGGATGMTHDWAISRAIVAAIRTPVILAGGLTPENVAQAIASVRPWGVDVHTGVEHADGRRDFDKIRAFVARAKGA